MKTVLLPTSLASPTGLPASAGACYIYRMRFFHLFCAVLLIAVGARAADQAPATEVARLQKKIKEDPKNAMYWNDLGAAYGRHGEWKNAVNALKKAVLIKKDYAHAWFNLGFAYENANVLGKAVEAYKKAVQFKKDFPEAWLSLGVTYQKQGKLGEARKILPMLEQQNSKMAAELARLIKNTPVKLPVKKKSDKT